MDFFRVCSSFACLESRVKVRRLFTLLGPRKVATSENIAAEQTARRATLAKAQAIVAAAVQARADALDSLDADGMATADEAAAAGRRTVEIEERALALLDDAHAKAVEAERAAAKAAALAVIVEQRRALAGRLAGDWVRAAAVMAEIISEARTIQRDVAEGGFEREVERLPEIARFLPCMESVAAMSAFIGDDLSGPPVVPESLNEASFREAEEARARRKAEEAQARRVKLNADAEAGRAAREAEDARERERERNLYYPTTWRDHLSDSAR